MSRGGHVQCCSNERPYFLLQERPSPSVRCWFPQLGWTWASLTGIFWPEARISKIHGSWQTCDKQLKSVALQVRLISRSASHMGRRCWNQVQLSSSSVTIQYSFFLFIFSFTVACLAEESPAYTHEYFLCLCLAVKIVAGQWILAPYWLQTPLNRTRHWSRASVSSCREKNWPEVQNAVVFVRRRKAHSLHIN